MEATEDRHRTDRSRRIHPLPCWRLRERLIEALVRTRPVEVGHVLLQHAGEVALTEDEGIVN
jgi:hypothetical protein